MDNCERILALLRQNRKGLLSRNSGIEISKIARQLGIHSSTVYRHLNSQDLMGHIRFERGIAYLSSEAGAEKPSRLNVFLHTLMRALSYLNVFSWPLPYLKYQDEKRKAKLKQLNIEYRGLLKKIDSNEDEWKP